MSRNLFQTNAALFAGLALLLSACKKPVNPCVQLLRQRDDALIHRADSLILRRDSIPFDLYRIALEQLRSEEKQLFREVENCDFGKDLQAYNYWHRGRLKFPGKIEQALQRLQSDSTGK